MGVFEGNFINKFIAYCETTREDEWCVSVVRSKDLKANCLFGHIFKMFNDNDQLGNKFWEFFEYHYATEYMVYPINDGENLSYQQSTPKQRCLQYLKDLRDGKTKTTLDYMREYDNDKQ